MKLKKLKINIMQLRVILSIILIIPFITYSLYYSATSKAVTSALSTSLSNFKTDSSDKNINILKLIEHSPSIGLVAKIGALEYLELSYYTRLCVNMTLANKNSDTKEIGSLIEAANSNIIKTENSLTGVRSKEAEALLSFSNILSSTVVSIPNNQAELEELGNQLDEATVTLSKIIQKHLIILPVILILGFLGIINVIELLIVNLIIPRIHNKRKETRIIRAVTG